MTRLTLLCAALVSVGFNAIAQNPTPTTQPIVVGARCDGNNFPIGKGNEIFHVSPIGGDVVHPGGG